MSEAIQSFTKILCQGGLNTTENYLALSDQNPGAATQLVNYETSLSGGYRRINGFREIEDGLGEVGVNAEGPVLGVFGYANDLYAARKDDSTATYSFYKYTPTVGWGSPLTTGISHVSTGVSKIRHAVFNFGDGDQIIFVDGVNHAVVFNGTNWYELKSTNSGGSSFPGGNQLIDAPAYVTVFKRHIFLSGDATADAVVVHSAPDDALTWTAAAGGGQLPVGFSVKQIRPFRDELFVFGLTAIKRIMADSAAIFVLQDVTDDLGCVSSDSVLEVSGNLIFLSSDGIRPIAGTDKIGDVELSLLSYDIQEIVRQFPEQFDLESLNGVVIRGKSQFRYFLADGNIPVAESLGLIGCVRHKFNERQWEFGRLLGIRTSCVWSGYINGVEKVYHGDYDGFVYEQEVGNTFDGADITAVYTTPYIDFGDTQIRKTLRTLNTFIKSDSELTIYTSIRFDWGKLDAVNPLNYTNVLEGSVSKYDSGIEYDDGNKYGGIFFPVVSENIEGSCFSVQISYVTTGDWSPYTIHGFVLEFDADGRI